MAVNLIVMHGATSSCPARRFADITPPAFSPHNGMCLVTRTLRDEETRFLKEDLKWTTWECRSRRDVDSDAD